MKIFGALQPPAQREKQSGVSTPQLKSQGPASGTGDDDAKALKECSMGFDGMFHCEHVCMHACSHMYM